MDKTSKRNVLDCPIDFDRAEFTDLLSLSAGWIISCQQRLGEIIGNDDWNVDLKQGMIKFGEHQYNAAVIGYESSGDNSWLWGWAHTESGLPEIVSAPSRRAKKAVPLCPELNSGKFLMDELHNAHNLSIVCCALQEKNACYYRCPIGDGSVAVTVEGVPDSVFLPFSETEFISCYMNIISSFYCDHRLLAAGFLYMNGNEFSAEGNVLVGKFIDRSMTFVFENAGGLYRLVDFSLN